MEACVVTCVFAVSGMVPMAVAPPLLAAAGIEGTMRDGPWSYRLAKVAVVSPTHVATLVVVGTAVGRNRFFAGVASKMIGRFLPSR